MFNWEELGKISSDLLRTMRYITFGEYRASYDGAFFGTKKKIYGTKEVYIHELDKEYKMYDVKPRYYEECQAKNGIFKISLLFKNLKTMEFSKKNEDIENKISKDESNLEVLNKIDIDNEDLEKLLLSVKGLGKKKLSKILSYYSHAELIELLEKEPRALGNIKKIDSKLLDRIIEAWREYKEDRVFSL